MMINRVIAFEIFKYLDFESLKNSRLVNRFWNSFLSEEKCLWFSKLKNHQWFKVIQEHKEEETEAVKNWSFLFENIQEIPELIILLNALTRFESNQPIWTLFNLKIYGPFTLVSWLKNENFLDLVISNNAYEEIDNIMINRILIWAVEQTEETHLLRKILPVINENFLNFPSNSDIFLRTIQNQDVPKLRILRHYLRNTVFTTKYFTEAIKTEHILVIQAMADYSKIELFENAIIYLRDAVETRTVDTYRFIRSYLEISTVEFDEILCVLVGNYSYGSNKNPVLEYLIKMEINSIMNEQPRFSNVRNAVIWAVNSQDPDLMMEQILPYIQEHDW